MAWTGGTKRAPRRLWQHGPFLWGVRQQKIEEKPKEKGERQPREQRSGRGAKSRAEEQE